MLTLDLVRPLPSGLSDEEQELRQLVGVVLAEVVARWPLRLAELTCPALFPDPVMVAGSPGQGTLHLRQLAFPPSGALAGGCLLVAGSSAESLRGVDALPPLVTALVESERGRAAAQALARGALQVANVDALTGLGNRRAWVHALRQECQRAARGMAGLAVLVLDVDGLKAVNDARGHAAGDELISRTAAVLRHASRTTDSVCRLGGDEFGIAAPGTDADQARRLADRVRALLADQGVPASVGLAVSGDCSGGPDELWQRADAAMYAAKRAGRQARDEQLACSRDQTLLLKINQSAT